MKTPRLLLLLLAGAVTAWPVCAQTTSHTMTDGTVVQFPDLAITGSTLAFSLTYDATRAVFRYSYTINAPVTNIAPIQSFKIDISGSTARLQIDPSLQENIVRRTKYLQPATTIPVGITVPDPTQWKGDVSRGGWAFVTTRDNLYNVQPNTTKSGFVMESKLGPGIRDVQITPSEKSWFDIWANLPDNGAEFKEPMPDVRDFVIKTSTIAPADLTDADLFDGGGQQPAEVNKFLRYAAPKESRIKVPANSTFTVIVYYGKTILPATFAATLDGVDVTSRFHAAPGGADAITIPIGTSTTKLHLSVDGTKTSGGTATDSDTLTFLPQ